MTSPRVKPVELVARAIADADQEDYMEDYRRYDRRSRAVLDAMRLHGLVSLSCIDLIHAEEDANGEPRTSIVPGRQG